MSNLHRTVIAARVARLHNKTPEHLERNEEEEDGLGVLPTQFLTTPTRFAYFTPFSSLTTSSETFSYT
jgi:hypothetical protein